MAGVLGGAIAPAASTALLAATGNGSTSGICVIVISLVSLVALVHLPTGVGVDASESEPGTALAGAA